MTLLHVPVNPVRVVTASSLFDGHDASINIMRRILQSQGAEVIHLGHNRSVREVVDAVIEEDAQCVAVSSYQGGHVEYFGYLVDLLAAEGAGHVRVFGGGGGVIVPAEIAQLAEQGVTIFSPEDGQRLGLAAMVNQIIVAGDAVAAARASVVEPVHPVVEPVETTLSTSSRAETVETTTPAALARAITLAEDGRLAAPRAAGSRAPVLGITGTGGSGKSSLTDELIRRFRIDHGDALRIAVVAIDPTRRRGGGALLGDRIRMNALGGGKTYFRSLATRGGREVPEHLADVIDVLRSADFDLIIVETPGIGQGDAGITPYVDTSLYVMTPEFGAASQLEKIDMLDFADVVAINKFERRGAADALRDVARQLVRNREQWGAKPDDMPVFGTSAATFNDDGVTALYQHLAGLLGFEPGSLPLVATKASTSIHPIVPSDRVRYLAEISQTVRDFHAETVRLAELARLAQAAELLGDRVAAERRIEITSALPAEVRDQLVAWPSVVADYDADAGRTSLAGLRIPRVAVPRTRDAGELVRYWRRENLPGHFPFTAGVFAHRRTDEDPARMFAGEGDAFRTNRRFKLLSEGQPATRLSTAFDSVTLYGRDPATPPDVYGKVGTSGVSIATLDDMKALYDGFDLSAPSTSVSMTINGPAPTVLAFYLNAAIDQAAERFRIEHGREADATERAELTAATLRSLRGTVQADILKEDQGQNTCLFSTEFSLRCMADIQEWFIAHELRHFYSVSISGYHMAEAGANPVSQLAFTLANAFTYVEAYLARGMAIDDFAPNLSFFFSNGMDPEYTVLGRVARRIWAITMRDRYGANERSQKLKYHVQTSGRSLHAQEMAFNDIRTTLQALLALQDNANSLHTNAFDEAVTTPTDDSVRRALAIQLVINREFGWSMNENPLQGSYLVDELTDLVEAAVLDEFDRINERGGVLGAMETGYQRGRIQDESMLYEHGKHDGSIPIIGVNTFLNPAGEPDHDVELRRASEDEKESQLKRVTVFRERHAPEAAAALARLREAATSGANIFEVLMDAARVCTLGQVTEAFFEVGGQYRRTV